MSCPNWTCTKRYKVVPLLFINHPSCLPIFRSRLIGARAERHNIFSKRWPASWRAFTRNHDNDTFTHLLLATSKISWKNKHNLVQSKVTEDSGNFFGGQKLGGFLWKKRTRLLYPATVELQKMRGFFYLKASVRPWVHILLQSLLPWPKIFYLIFPLCVFFWHRVTCFGHFLKMAPMVSKDSPHRHEMGLRWEFVWGQRNAGEKWHRIKTQWSST